jgi:PDZ domain-containing protein
MPGVPFSLSAPARSRRSVVLTVCAAVVLALLGVAAFAPLPFTIMYPGITANTLGSYPDAPPQSGQPTGDKPVEVITVTGHPVRQTVGQLRMTTISATSPQDSVSLWSALRAWPAKDEAVVPHDAVYPAGQNTRQVEQTNQQEMNDSQSAAASAALSYLHLDPAQVKVTISLADVGGPSAGLMFTLGVIDELAGNGTGKAGAAGDLTNGAVIAGTGEIDSSGQVSAVGGVALKTKAAAAAKATVFLLPRGECGDGQAGLPSGLRLVPVDDLDQAIAALKTLQTGSGTLPTC